MRAGCASGSERTAGFLEDHASPALQFAQLSTPDCASPVQMLATFREPIRANHGKNASRRFRQRHDVHPEKNAPLEHGESRGDRLVLCRLRHFPLPSGKWRKVLSDLAAQRGQKPRQTARGAVPQVEGTFMAKKSSEWNMEIKSDERNRQPAARIRAVASTRSLAVSPAGRGRTAKLVGLACRAGSNAFSFGNSGADPTGTPQAGPTHTSPARLIRLAGLFDS